jgi:hypothetical protein
MRIALVVSSRISQAASLTALLCTTVEMLCSVLSRAVLGGRIGLSRKRAMQLCEDKESPLDVMFDNMLFWHRQSKDLGGKLNAICGKIKNDDDRREAMSLARMFLSARENAQRCAVDGAPYVHAKLQAVHHEHGPLLEPVPDWQQDDGGADGTADRRRAGRNASSSPCRSCARRNGMTPRFGWAGVAEKRDVRDVGSPSLTLLRKVARKARRCVGRHSWNRRLKALATLTGSPFPLCLFYAAPSASPLAWGFLRSARDC